MMNNEKTNLIDTVLEVLEKINPSFGSFEDLGAMLALPDEQFELLGTYFLNEMEKALNNSNERLALTNIMSTCGLNVEDLKQHYQAAAEEIDEKLSDFPAAKKDFLKAMLAMIINAIEDADGATKKIVQIPIELSDEAIMPSYAREGDAGLDVYSMIDVDVAPGQTVLIPTGIKVAIPIGYELQVRDKSGIALKTKLRVANAPGTIDSGFRSEVGVIIENIEPPIKNITYDFEENGKPIITSILHGKSYHIEKGQKIAQLVLSEVPSAAFFKVNSVADFGVDRQGGFGSTGLKENGKN